MIYLKHDLQVADKTCPLSILELIVWVLAGCLSAGMGFTGELVGSLSEAPGPRNQLFWLSNRMSLPPGWLTAWLDDVQRLCVSRPCANVF